MDATSLDGLAEHFQKKLDTVNTIMDLRSADEDEGESYQSQVVSLQTELDSLQVVIALMKTEVNKQTIKLKQTQSMKTDMETLVSNLSHAVSYIPSRMPKPAQKEAAVEIRDKPAVTTKTTAAQSKKSTNQGSCKENQPPRKNQSGGKKQKNVYIPTLEYITVEDFENVPKYIKGRMNYNQINTMMDEINKAYKEKYKILSMKRTTLNDVNRKRFEKFKLQESKETTGEHFIVDDDIKEFSHMKMDSVYRSVLTLLRHCGRLKEIRGGGHTRYACVEIY
ncbi:spindle and kinetochore-associated protein 1-like [Mizuhopecten yessoensis]|uniref:SKA complex subunit 1 n=1 Tax=Mizuhopecten yessoensis TaxID=6573 RepID=A0A210PEJ3_MIZYE|nr:spindle and kinetochore-associated protein 1-like [Mizuhopecten yessoensis]OWF34876.1 Spindle and kinetochore-associated protein 1 [Mizuhopecten yessoensis]